MAAIATALVIILTAAYFVTHGKWDFFVRRGFVSFYDEQGRSLSEGRWDVDIDGIRGEAFMVNGKAYGYFGFVPALPRIILNHFFPSYFGTWSRWSMIVSMASLAAAFFAFLALLESPAVFEPLVLLLLLGGTTAIFLCASSLTYHEAIMWGGALAVWAYIWYGRYLKTGKFVFLFLGALSGFGAFFTRASSGSGTLFCAALILAALVAQQKGAGKPPHFLFRICGNWCRPQSQNRVVHGTFLASYLVAVIVAFLTINHAKFGTYTDPMPLRYAVLYGPERVARIKGSLVHPELFPALAVNYFDPTHINLTPEFPYLHLTQRAYASNKMDAVEPYASFPAAMPAMLLLAAAGLWFLSRQAGRSFQWCVPILLGALVGGLPLLSFAYMSYRYQHDWFPLFFCAAMLGAVAVPQIRDAKVRKAVLATLVTTAVWSVWANVSFLIQLQHQGGWGD